MRPNPLLRLVEAARALPGDSPSGTAPLPATQDSSAIPVVDGDLPDVTSLRRKLGALLSELSQRLDPALAAAMGRAGKAWDQVDAVTVFDQTLGQMATEIRREAERLRYASEPALAAAGLETLATLNAATGLVALFERRLAMMVRLRLRAGGELLDEGRPFLDLAAALAAAAKAWS